MMSFDVLGGGGIGRGWRGRRYLRRHFLFFFFSCFSRIEIVGGRKVSQKGQGG